MIEAKPGVATDVSRSNSTCVGLFTWMDPGTTETVSSLFVTVTRVALFVMCIRFVGVPESAASWVAVFCVWAIVRGLTVVPLMPGGVGVSEVAYVAMLTPIAGTQYVNQITAGVLVYRILTWLLMIPAGGVAIGLWRIGLRRSEPATS